MTSLTDRKNAAISRGVGMTTQVYADRVGGEATHAGAKGLDAAVREASKVLVLDPSAMRARMTRDRAFTATAAPAARRDLLTRLAPYQDRVSWLSRPA